MQKKKRPTLIKSDLSNPSVAVWAGNINKYDVIDINQISMTLVPLRVSKVLKIHSNLFSRTK